MGNLGTVMPSLIKRMWSPGPQPLWLQQRSAYRQVLPEAEQTKLGHFLLVSLILAMFETGNPHANQPK